MSAPNELQAVSISGSVPGQLDASQKLRVLTSENSALIFASFDPKTASNEDGIPEMRRLSLHDQLCRPKRVVVEVLANGQSTWRFVPKARREEGVEDEGQWPKVVDVCGQMVSMTRDQWDIYTLDPIYDCLIRKPPAPPIITSKPNGLPSSPVTPTFKTPDRPSLKRPHSTSPITPTSESFATFAGPPRNRARVEEVPDEEDLNEEEEEEDEIEEASEVEEMVVDDSKSKNRAPKSDRLERVRRNRVEARQRRRELINERQKKIFQEGIIYDEPDSMNFGMEDEANHLPTSAYPNAEAIKRAGSVKRKLEDDDYDDDDDDLGSIASSVDSSRFSSRFSSPAAEPKRHRTLSPGSIRREIEVKRSDRGRKRKQELDKRHHYRSDLRHQRMYEEILQEAKENHFNRAQSVPTEHNTYHYTASSSAPFSRRSNEPTSPVSETPLDEDAAHQAQLEASKRKLAELERDRPIWEEAARLRQEEERRAAEQRGRQPRAQSQSAEASSSKQPMSERARKQQEEQAANARQATDKRLRRERLLQEARAEIEYYRRGRAPWTAMTALQRYRTSSERFDVAKFHTGEDTIVFEAIPWPMLQCPGTFSVEDIDWSSVEAFFGQARQIVNHKEFCVLVEKSHKRFHPDRWRSRRVLMSVDDEEERQCLEVAANTVAQALTPIWKEVTGR